MTTAITRLPLSGSADGQGIKVAATGSPGTLVHTAHATATDEVWLWCVNSSASSVKLTVQFGNGASSALNVNGNAQTVTGNPGSGQSTGMTLGAKRDNTASAPIYVAFAGLYVGDVTSDPAWAAFQSWAQLHFGVTLG